MIELPVELFAAICAVAILSFLGLLVDAVGEHLARKNK
jgi:hypothetical protein